MDSEDNDKSMGARQPDDDPRPGFYHAYREAEFDYIMARDRQKYAEEKYENLKRKYKQLKLRFGEEHALGEDLKSAIQSLTSSEKRQEIVNDLLWLYRTGSMERIKEEQRNQIAKWIIGAVRDENEQQEEKEQEEEKH